MVVGLDQNIVSVSDSQKFDSKFRPSNFSTTAVSKPRRAETEVLLRSPRNFSRRIITLVLDEENMKPEKSAMTPKKFRNQTKYHEKEKW